MNSTNFRPQLISMKFIMCTVWCACLLVTFSISCAANAPRQDELETKFQNPPDSAKPFTWWHWMNGHISKDGITRDLEDMKKAGLGGFTLWNASQGIPTGPVTYFSPKWWELLKHTVSEAQRLDLKMGMGNCAGWSSSGGPWVTPDRAMQEVAWTEKLLVGPSEFDGILEIPTPALGIERDMKKNPEINKRYYVPREQVRGYYRDIALLAFPTLKGDKAGKPIRLENWKAKAGFSKSLQDSHSDKRTVEESDIVRADKVIDLTQMLDGKGWLKWKVPPGDWTLLRIGYQPTGRKNHPAPKEGEGLEIDKLSADAVDFHWKNSAGKFIHAAGEAAGKTFNDIVVDSYEVGHQNWNSSFEQNFRRLRGYDLKSYLPALTGRVMGDVPGTEKFLWDFRKTLSDLIVQNYYGRLAELSHKDGMRFSCEAYGSYGNTDDFAASGVPDIPMCEWWAFRSDLDNTSTARLASSSAHTGGRKVVGSEAFTGPLDRIFEEHPNSLKAQGDYFFCQGVNRFNFHTFVHDPYQKAPGLGLGCYGSRIDSRNTWWPYAGAWFKYLARCQYLLQQGQAVADLLYYVGEDAPNVAKPRGYLVPAPPAGVDYDFCNHDTLDRLEVTNGRLVLPGGMSYRMLVLPQDQRMRPETLCRIEALVTAGAVVVGAKPQGMPGLEGGAAAEATLKEDAEKLWGKCDGVSVKKHVFGKGRIYWGLPLEEVFKEIGLSPDFLFDVRSDGSFGPTQFPGNGIEFTHFGIDEADFYFVSNQHHQPKTIQASFRISGRAPELWHPDTGQTEAAPEFQTAGVGRTNVTLRLDPAGSVFVVFRKPRQGGDSIVAVEKDGRLSKANLHLKGKQLFLSSREPGEFTLKSSDGGIQKVVLENVLSAINLAGPWSVSFPPGWGAPEQIVMPTLVSWTQHENPDVKCFSGTGTYRIEADIPAVYLSEGRRLILDLGDVQVIAEVRVNGKNLGILWKAPYEVDATKALHPGGNQFEIRVANLWVNRLIGDRKYPDDSEWTAKTGTTEKGEGLVKVPDWVVNNTPRPVQQRKTFVAWRWPHLEKKELLPSGLIGPVRLVSEIEAQVTANPHF